MSEIHRVGYDTVKERDLYSCGLPQSGDLPTSFPWHVPHFACLLAWEAVGVDASEITTIAENLLDAGCVYFVCWGPDCERVHDIIDEVIAVRQPVYDSVMTTWHNDMPLPEAIWYFLNNTWPDEEYFDTCKAGLGIAIDCEAWSAEMRAAFEDPRAFSARLVGTA